MLWAITVLSSIGILICIYFFLMDVSPKIKNVCNIHGCLEALNSDFRSLLGVKNYIWGVFYYLFVFGYSLEAVRWNVTILFASIAVALYSAYLCSVLIRELEINCVLCYSVSAINMILLILVSVS